MAIRVRKIQSKKAGGGFHYVALCAAETKAEPGDIYLDDSVHHALSEKFYADHVKMGFIKEKKKPEVTELWIKEMAWDIWNKNFDARVETYSLGKLEEFIKKKLKEAGVEVEEK